MEDLKTLEHSIARIQKMELCFDILQRTAKVNPEAIRGDASLRVLFRGLVQYYESDQWMHDYELDEKGLLPPDLKRGVLAQDAVYNFLDQVGSAG